MPVPHYDRLVAFIHTAHVTVGRERILLDPPLPGLVGAERVVYWRLFGSPRFGPYGSIHRA